MFPLPELPKNMWLPPALRKADDEVKREEAPAGSPNRAARRRRDKAVRKARKRNR